MFDAKSKADDGPGTIVGANVKLTGTLKDSNDITVYGQVQGEVISDKFVIVANSAKVTGPIIAKSVSVAGTVNGEITAKEKLEILETGKVIGSIDANDLIIKSGALFNGKCKMKNDEAPLKAAQTAEKEATEEFIKPKKDKDDKNNEKLSEEIVEKTKKEDKIKTEEDPFKTLKKKKYELE